MGQAEELPQHADSNLDGPWLGPGGLVIGLTKPPGIGRIAMRLLGLVVMRFLRLAVARPPRLGLVVTRPLGIGPRIGIFIARSSIFGRSLLHCRFFSLHLFRLEDPFLHCPLSPFFVDILL